MIHFEKLLREPSKGRETDPLLIYDNLDRQTDKGPLRPVQEEVLREWHQSRRGEADLLVKLGTGEGKTLIGLLMLQSSINEGKSPCAYFCPSNLLVEQTIQQASDFGLQVCTPSETDLATEFLAGERILITTIQKLFNGKSKFITGTGIKIGSLVIDDVHSAAACIREAFRMRIPRSSPDYKRILELFEEDLAIQGLGTLADIKQGRPGDHLPVPYWAVFQKREQTTRILSNQGTDSKNKFVWPLIKDIVDRCQIHVATDRIEVEPYVALLDRFPAYMNAARRIFMSATVANDSFLVKGLGIPAKTIMSPLPTQGAPLGGERMVLIPSLMHENLDHHALLNWLAPPDPSRKKGRVVIVPSSAAAVAWRESGAVVLDNTSIESELAKMRQGEYKHTRVLVNRYDGIDLPDRTCRILVLDGCPYADNLSDRYDDSCRPNSEQRIARLARAIEQGLGRSVRGPKDYSVVMLLGEDLIRAVREPRTSKGFSEQLRIQIEIGLQIASLSKADYSPGESPITVLKSVISKCLQRDQGWKDYYREHLEGVRQPPPNEILLLRLEREREAELAFVRGQSSSQHSYQELADSCADEDELRAWYLQQLARCIYIGELLRSTIVQQKAHSLNHRLLKRLETDTIRMSSLTSTQRVSRILAWLRDIGGVEGIYPWTQDIFKKLQWGASHLDFEGALHELGLALGLGSTRPERFEKQGPDNLLYLDDFYYVIECKSEVEVERSAMHRSEIQQITTSTLWFERRFPSFRKVPVLICPTHRIARDAEARSDLRILSQQGLQAFLSRCRHFYSEMGALGSSTLEETRIKALLTRHKLHPAQILGDHLVEPSRIDGK